MARLAWLAPSLLLSALLFAAGAATAADSDPVSGPITGDRQQQLRNLLVQDCGSCHGLTFRGGLGPALVPERLEGKSTQYLSAIILDGVPGSAMPGWRPMLSDDEARWLAELLLQGDASVESGS